MAKTHATVEKALRKVYLVKNNAIHLPDCLFGKRIRIVLNDDEDDKDNKHSIKVKELIKEIDKLRTELDELHRLRLKVIEEELKIKKGVE